MPDWDVTIGKRGEKGGEKTFSRKVDAGWTNKAGGINVVLDPGVGISTPEGVSVTLWPFKPRDERGPRAAPASTPAHDPETGEVEGDDIPF
jgi:hypothetical protein